MTFMAPPIRSVNVLNASFTLAKGNECVARGIKDKSEVVVTSLISLPEVMSAINRAWRERRCSKSDMELVRSEFLRIWPKFQWIRVSERLMYQAGQLIFSHNLKGFDAVHLASALVLKEEGGSLEIFFSCFDRNLNRAAQEEGFVTHKYLE